MEKKPEEWESRIWGMKRGKMNMKGIDVFKCQEDPTEALPPALFKEYRLSCLPTVVSLDRRNTSHALTQGLAEARPDSCDVCCLLSLPGGTRLHLTLCLSVPRPQDRIQDHWLCMVGNGYKLIATLCIFLENAKRKGIILDRFLSPSNKSCYCYSQTCMKIHPFYATTSLPRATIGHHQESITTLAFASFGVSPKITISLPFKTQ